jgi:site-specific DNA-methyltransferase (adenine-specific)
MTLPVGEIICGDCLAVMRGWPAGCVDAVITDPPYKLSQAYSAVVDPDNVEAVACLWPVAREMNRVAKPGALCALFYDSRIMPFALRVMKDGGWAYLRNLTLYRRWGQASLVHGWMSTSDFILLFYKPGAKPVFHGDDVRHDVYLKAGPEDESSGHPAQKPLDPLTHIVGRISPPDALILDPFCGSGSTLVAAERLGRRWIGIDIDPHWCDVARRRTAQRGLFQAAIDAATPEGE